MSIDQAPEPFGKAVFHGVLGLALLAVAAHLVVDGGRAVALALGWSEFVVGALVIAIATSTPELATTLVARMRGHDEVGLGNILGSNLFNGCFIVAVLALIRPFEVTLGEVAPSLIVGVVTAILIWPGKSGTLGRGRGALLLGIYALYVGYTLMMPAGHA